MNTNKKLFIILTVILLLGLLSIVSANDREGNDIIIMDNSDLSTTNELLNDKSSDIVLSSDKQVSYENDEFTGSIHEIASNKSNHASIDEDISDDYSSDDNMLLDTPVLDGGIVLDTPVLDFPFEGGIILDDPIILNSTVENDSFVNNTNDSFVNNTNDSFVNNTIALTHPFDVHLTKMSLSIRLADENAVLTVRINDANNNTILNSLRIYLLVNDEYLTNEYGRMYFNTFYGKDDMDISLDTLKEYGEYIEFKAVFEGSGIYQPSMSNKVFLNLTDNKTTIDDSKCNTNTSLSVEVYNNTVFFNASVEAFDNHNLDGSVIYFIADDEYILHENQYLHAEVINNTACTAISMKEFTTDNKLCEFQAEFIEYGQYQSSTSDACIVNLTYDSTNNYLYNEGSYKTMLSVDLDEDNLYLTAFFGNCYGKIISNEYLNFLIDDEYLRNRYSIVNAYQKYAPVTVSVPISNINNKSEVIKLQSVLSADSKYNLTISNPVWVNLSSNYSNKTNDTFNTSTILHADLTDDLLKLHLDIIASDDNFDNAEVTFFANDDYIWHEDSVIRAYACDRKVNTVINLTDLSSYGDLINITAKLENYGLYKSSMSNIVTLDLTNKSIINNDYKLPADITLNASHDNKNIYLNVTVSTEANVPVDGLPVYFMLNGESLKIKDSIVTTLTNQSNAVIQIPIDILNITGNALLEFKAVLGENELYTECISDAVDMNLVATETALSANLYDDELRISCNVSYGDAECLNDALVYFVIDDEILCDEDNVIIKNTSDNITIYLNQIHYMNDYFKIKAVYNGSEEYLPSSSDEVIINLTQFDSNITQTNITLVACGVDDKICLISDVLSEGNEPINRKDAVYYIIDNQEILKDSSGVIYVDVVDSKASVKIPDSYVFSDEYKTHTIQAVFVGDNQYTFTNSNIIELTCHSDYFKDVTYHHNYNTTTVLTRQYQDEDTVGFLLVTTCDGGSWINVNDADVYFIINDEYVLKDENNNTFYVHLNTSALMFDVPIDVLWKDNLNTTLRVRAVYPGYEEYYGSISDDINLSIYDNCNLESFVYIPKVDLDYTDISNDSITLNVKIGNGNSRFNNSRAYFILNDEKILTDDIGNTIYLDVSDATAQITLPMDYIISDKYAPVTLKVVFDKIMTDDDSIQVIVVPYTSQHLKIIKTDDEIRVNYDINNLTTTLNVTEYDDYILLSSQTTNHGRIMDDGVVMFKLYDHEFIVPVVNATSSVNISKDYLLSIDYDYYDTGVECVKLYPFTSIYESDRIKSQSNYVLVNITTESNIINLDEYTPTITDFNIEANGITPTTYSYSVSDNEGNVIESYDSINIHKSNKTVVFIYNGEFIDEINPLGEYEGYLQLLFKGYDNYLSSISSKEYVSIHFIYENDTVVKTFSVVRQEKTDTSTVITTPKITNKAVNSNSSRQVEIVTKSTNADSSKMDVTSNTNSPATIQKDSKYILPIASSATSIMDIQTISNNIDSLATSSILSNKQYTLNPVSTIITKTINNNINNPISTVNLVTSSLKSTDSNGLLSAVLVEDKKNNIVSSIADNLHDSIATSTLINNLLPANKLSSNVHVKTLLDTMPVLPKTNVFAQSSKLQQSKSSSLLSVLPSVTASSGILSVVGGGLSSSISQVAFSSLSPIAKIFTLSSLFSDPSTKQTQIAQTQSNSLITQMVRVVPENTYTVKVNHEIVYNGTIVTFTLLSDIFGEDFRNSHVIVYLDGQIIFNDTLDNNLEVELLKLVESLIGVHELKIEYIDSNNKTKVLTKNITIE